jgi:tRNA(Ile)-lysidine synthase TilS/MesJ
MVKVTIGKERLNGLALLHIYKDIPKDIENIIARFVKQKKDICFYCRLLLLQWLINCASVTILFIIIFI